MARKHLQRAQPFDRSERVSERIRDAVASTCLFDITDDRLQGIEITKVHATKDLRLARVYFYCEEANSDHIAKVHLGFKSAVGFLKKAIGREVNLKYMPEIEFYYDDSVDHERKMNKLIEDLNITKESE